MINDALDLPNDRLHPAKRLRPLASGELNIRWAAPLCAACLAASGGIALLLPAKFGLLLLCYFATTLAYSFYLRRLLLADVFILAFLYALRVMLGGAAAGIAISNWLFAFMGCFFLGLAILKRTSDHILAGGEKDFGRAYASGDMSILEMMEVGCAFSAAIIFCLYIDSEQARLHYARPAFLWLICPLLTYWQLRLIILAHRGEALGDPLMYAINDKTSYFLLLLIFILFLCAI